jgi:Family of unknown function (DUF6186)
MNLSIPVIEYLAAIAVAAVLWLAGRRWPEKLAPIGKVVDRLMHRRGSRLAVVIIWWWLGWHFFTM